MAKEIEIKTEREKGRKGLRPLRRGWFRENMEGVWEVEGLFKRK